MHAKVLQIHKTQESPSQTVNNGLPGCAFERLRGQLRTKVYMQPQEFTNSSVHAPQNLTVVEESRPLPRLAYSIAEVALMLGLSQKTIHRFIQRGLLKPLRAARHLRVPRLELDRFLRER